MSTIPSPTAGKPSAAEVSALEQAFARDPMSEAYRPLAEAYLALGRFMEAMIVAKKGVRARPSAAAPHVLLARIYAEQGKHPKAIEELAAAVTNEPGDLPAKLLLAAEQFKVQDPAAVGTLLSAHAVAPMDPGVLDLMKRYGVEPPRPRPPPATARPAATPAAPHPAAARTRSVTRPAIDVSRYEREEPVHGVRSGFLTLAIVVVGVLALVGWFVWQDHVHRRDREITRLLKETKDQLAKDDYGGYQQAEKLAQQVLDADPTNYAAEAYVAYIDALRYGENGEGSDYLARAQGALARAKAAGRPHAYLFAAQAYLQYFTGHAKEAEETLAGLLHDSAGGQRAYNSDLLSGALGIVQMGEGKLAAARKSLVDAHNLAPADVRIAAALGTLDSRLDSPATAAAFFQQALRIDPDHVPSNQGLALLDLAQDPPDLSGAQKIVSHLAQLGAGAMSPRQAAFERFVDAQLLYAQGKSKEAAAEETIAMDLDSKSVDMPIIEGLRQLRAGHADRAAALFTSALALDPNRPVALVGLGRAYLAQAGEPAAKRAIAPLRQALALVPGDVLAMVALGNALSRTGDVDGARDAWQQAVSREADLLEAHLALARYWTAKGDGGKAKAEWQQLAAHGSGGVLAEADTELGRYAEAKGDKKGAEDLFAKAIAAEDSYGPAYFFAGQMLVHDRRRRRDAKGFLAQYLKLAPDGPYAPLAKKLAR